jgi:methanogenic corrinoid protein MtbC1
VQVVAGREKILAKLRDIIINFDVEGVKRACQEALEAGIPAYKAVIGGMAKGMEIVGQKYEDGEYFLVEVIMAGETMKKGMTVLEPHLKAENIKSAGEIVIGTVKGDLHDIGKNVFAILAKAANFNVIDLGVDVSAEQFVAAVRKHPPDIVAMSALLTSTMTEMENIILELRKAGLRDKVKIIIGGAQTTPEYARKIGADAAANDAIEGLRICTGWMKTE